VSTWTAPAPDGATFTVRPIRPDDEKLMVDLHRRLSETSVYLRFFVPLKLDVRVAHDRLFTKCFIDYDREIALVAEHTAGGARQPAGLARMTRTHPDNTAEVAFLVADEFQNRGLGTYLLDRIIHVARKEGLSALEAATLSENYSMKDMFARAGFRFTPP